YAKYRTGPLSRQEPSSVPALHERQSVSSLRKLDPALVVSSLQGTDSMHLDLFPIRHTSVETVIREPERIAPVVGFHLHTYERVHCRAHFCFLPTFDPLSASFTATSNQYDTAPGWSLMS